VGTVGRFARGRLAVAPELVAGVVIERLRAASVAVRRLRGVVLPRVLPPRAALGLAELPDQFVERLRGPLSVFRSSRRSISASNSSMGSKSPSAGSARRPPSRPPTGSLGLLVVPVVVVVANIPSLFIRSRTLA